MPRTVTAEVLHVEKLTPGWRRVIIDASDAYPYLQRFLERTVDGAVIGAFHMALFFPVRREQAANYPRLSGPFATIFDVDPSLYHDHEVEVVSRRMYTIRPVDSDWHHMELNFALHGDGIATSWAQTAQAGMPLLIDMGDRVVDTDEFPLVGTYLLMGDEPSMPSIATMLQRLPSTSRIVVFIEVQGSQDQWVFETNGNATIEWIHRGDQESGTTDFLTECCDRFDWPADGDVHVWAAAEGRRIYALRKHVREVVGLERGQYQLMGYWRRGIRTERVLEIEGQSVNARLAAGLSPFEIPADSDQDNKTPYELLEHD